MLVAHGRRLRDGPGVQDLRRTRPENHGNAEHHGEHTHDRQRYDQAAVDRTDLGFGEVHVQSVEPVAVPLSTGIRVVDPSSPDQHSDPEREERGREQDETEDLHRRDLSDQRQDHPGSLGVDVKGVRLDA